MPTPSPSRTPAPAVPDPSDRSTFGQRAQAWTQWQNDHLGPEMEAFSQNAYTNAVEAAASADQAESASGNAASSAADAAASAQTAVNSPNTQATSNSSLFMGGGPKNLTLVETDKSFVQSQWVTLQDRSNVNAWMTGVITAFDATAKTMTVYIHAISAGYGGTTSSTWTITAGSPAGAASARSARAQRMAYANNLI